MDNLDKLIDDLETILTRKQLEQYYLITSNLSVKVSNTEVLQNWSCFLSKNNIELILIDTCGMANSIPKEEEQLLRNLINREQHRLKNKLIFPMQYRTPDGSQLKFYVLTSRENAQKLVVLGSFEN